MTDCVHRRDRGWNNGSFSCPQRSNPGLNTLGVGRGGGEGRGLTRPWTPHKSPTCVLQSESERGRWEPGRGARTLTGRPRYRKSAVASGVKRGKGFTVWTTLLLMRGALSACRSAPHSRRWREGLWHHRPTDHWALGQEYHHHHRHRHRHHHHHH